MLGYDDENIYSLTEPRFNSLLPRITWEWFSSLYNYRFREVYIFHDSASKYVGRRFLGTRPYIICVRKFGSQFEWSKLLNVKVILNSFVFVESSANEKELLRDDHYFVGDKFKIIILILTQFHQYGISFFKILIYVGHTNARVFCLC